MYASNAGGKQVFDVIDSRGETFRLICLVHKVCTTLVRVMRVHMYLRVFDAFDISSEVTMGWFPGLLSAAVPRQAAWSHPKR